MRNDTVSVPSTDPDDIGYNTTANPELGGLIAARLSRRGVLRTAGGALLAGASLAACGGGGDDGPAAPPPAAGPAPAPAPVPPAPAPAPAAPKLGFHAVAKSTADLLTVPAGYTATVLFRLGDPMAADVPAYKNDGTDAPASYDRRAGDHHDGMHFFGLNAAGGKDTSTAAVSRGLLAMNHEAITPKYLHPTGPTIAGSGAAAVRSSADEVLREFYLHGVSVVEVARTGTTWAYKQDSAFNRRVHTLTPMEFGGPVRGSDLVKTRYSPAGTAVRGTVNNCANGNTPWGTYLTCEENWAGYFRRIAASDTGRSAKEAASFARYGVAGNGRELWATPTPDTTDSLYGRWNTQATGASATDDYRNGHNTYGWVVEIDPYAPTSTPKKRTALGRFGHEGACLGKVVVGQPLVWYMGDDARNEYLYKFVSTAVWSAADANGGMAAGDKYMDSGKLYVAKFAADGTGSWVELAFGVNGLTAANTTYAFSDQADVLCNARIAADIVGATKMDRPEWTAVNPKNGEVYLTLTNTNAASRPVTATDAANPRAYAEVRANGSAGGTGNPNGHIVRFAETANAGLTFQWDVYLFGARAAASANVNVSNLTADNDFSSPDGLWFSYATPGLTWLQTDDGAYTDVTNCMMLAALPGTVGDGGAKTITNTIGTATREQATRVGAAPTDATLRRFLVGPKECEITGIAESGDGRAIFVNIQHPGEDSAIDYANPAAFPSHWPDGGASRPRSATVVITRNDGGIVGL